jgi:hypothetical protein
MSGIARFLPAMPAKTRYRIEEGRSCIDIRVKHTSQLFDGRDPAPFRDRDLDEDAVEYLLTAAPEIPRKQPIQIVITISEEAQPTLGQDVIADAVRGHFAYEREQIERRLREHVRRGHVILAVGLAALVLCLSLAEFTASLPPGHTREILREGLVITGWVAMWRPLDVLLYDWWPLIDERRQVDRILKAPVLIRYDSDGGGGHDPVDLSGSRQASPAVTGAGG